METNLIFDNLINNSIELKSTNFIYLVIILQVNKQLNSKCPLNFAKKKSTKYKKKKYWKICNKKETIHQSQASKISLLNKNNKKIMVGFSENPFNAKNKKK